ALSKLTYDRMKVLIVRDAASQQEVDESAAAMRQMEAAVNVDKASLANAELQLSYTKITAPIRGRVGLRMLDRGNMVKANDVTGIAVITQLQPISVVFSIPQDDIPAVRQRLNEAGSIEVLAYDRSFKELIATGNFTAVDNQVDASTGTLKLKATFANEKETLFPNQFVNIRLLVKQWEDAIVVPSTAIQRGPDFPFVYIAKEDETVDIRQVEIAFSDAGKTVIQTGIAAGEKVVVEGTDKLQPGGKVTLPGSKPPSQDKAGAGKPSESKPSEGKSSEGKPSESKPSESKPIESK
ncbi:MAG: efflux RND transporter periplasmic adaptor subunit, partial [Pirellulaceae bacterium]|nr:efflux RND transporter periplasmic adaptor subunit [Pirellulaceae bacterium]